MPFPPASLSARTDASPGTPTAHAADHTAERDAINDTVAELVAHEADTAGVHGIADTSLLETTAGAQAKADAAQAAAIAASQPVDSDLTAIAALSTTAFGRALLALADAAAGRTAFGLGTAATAATGDFDPAGAAAAAQAASQPVDADLTAIAALTTTAYGRGFLALADAAAGRTALGLGTAAVANTGDFQAADADLTAIAGLTSAADRLPYFTGSGTAALATFTTFGRSLVDDADATAARSTLGLGTAAVANTGTGSGNVLAFDSGSDATLAASAFTSGELVGGLIKHTSGILIDNSLGTVTQDPATPSPTFGDPPAELVGVGVNFRHNVTLSYVGGVSIGPRPQLGWFGPRGSFNVEGVAQYNNSTSTYGLTLLPFLATYVSKNKSGSGAITLTPSWTFVASNFYLADGTTVTASGNDTLDGPAAFIDTTVFQTLNTGTFTGTSRTIYSYASYPQIAGGHSWTARVGYEYRDYNSPNLNGIVSTLPDGTNVTNAWDTGTGTVGTQVALRVGHLTNATTNKAIQIGNGAKTFTADPTNGTAFIDILPDTTTLNFANAILGAAVRARGTVEYQQSGNAFGSLKLFQFDATLKNKNGVVANPGITFGYVANPTFQADGATTTGGTHDSFFATFTTSIANAGTMSAFTINQFHASLSDVGASTTVTLRRGFYVDEAGTVGGTVTTQVGVDIPTLTKAATNIGLRNAAMTVYTPTVSTISAASSTIGHTASVMRLNNTSGGAVTLTSAPTMTDGVDGEVVIIFNASTNNVVIQDQGTLANSNLRLGAASRTLGTRDSIHLMYSSTVGDWIELAFSNVT